MSNPISNVEQNDMVSFFKNIDRFLDKTTEYVHLGANPGDYYKAIWSRDAAFILKDQFLTGDTYNVLRTLYFIWAHQIDPDGNGKIIYGRGSPELDFSIRDADSEAKKRFKGALPSTIYHNQGFSEVYGLSPDIDSTALIISTTSWILDVYLKAGLYSYYQSLSEWASASTPPSPSLPPESARPLSSADYNKQQIFHPGEQEPKSPTIFDQSAPPLKIISKPTELMDFIVPRMLAAVDYLAGRDVDSDGLLEQGYNEDWMDTTLRSGKIVYSQACWILALSNFSSLLYTIGEYDVATRLTEMAERAVHAVEEKLWSEQDGAYIDIKFDGVGGKSESSGNHEHDKILTQDVALYLVSITENTFNDILSMRFKSNDDQAAKKSREHPQNTLPRIPHKNMERRAVSTLETIKNRIWMDSAWPLVTEKALKRTGPWRLDPNQYHNHTFWPWITGIEMLARSRFQRYQECNELLSALTRGSHPETLAFYEWVNPKTGKGDGAFPFRTGISTIRIALTDILLSHV
jgi:glycogen debranching enzyme